MEIGTQEIELSDRLNYIESISENQYKYRNRFPWSIAILFLVIGTMLGVAAYSSYLINNKEKERKK